MAPEVLVPAEGLEGPSGIIPKGKSCKYEMTTTKNPPPTFYL